MGILLSRKAAENIVINNIVRDTDCNYMLMDVEYKEKKYIWGAIYGVNRDEGVSMYSNLERDIKQLKTKNIVLGGDWNGTWDCTNVENNIDILNMANVPSLRRSNAINLLARNLGTTDPYRIFYPDTREYTFIPSGDLQNNRSRLDYYLVSKALCESIINVNIPHSLSSTVFDHKSVSLIFRRKANSFKYFVKDNFIDDSEFKSAVHIAVVECYVIHARVNANFTEAFKQEILDRIGNLTLNLQELQHLKVDEATNGARDLLTLEIEGKRGEISLNLENLPSLDFLDSLALDPDPSIFFETLVMCIKNNALLEQKRIGTLGNIKKNEVISRIKALKKDNNGNVNSQQILREERLLSNLVETDLKRDLENYRKFETLNDEKITPYFMSLVKNSSKGESPTLIKNENGLDFNSLEELSSHVEDYYKGIYREDPNAVETNSVSQIENFLGPEVSNRPEVANSKLSEEEKNELESPLTLHELEKSINSANMKSAPGSNGISNRFIKKFWEFFKRPLLKCANYSFETGRLSDSFRTADIKLIPKKGSDLSKIKNWRPISLLNCFYKCISRAFASRIKKYMNKLTPCAQKGYANGRYCQEVLMSVLDTIETCKAKKLRAVFCVWTLKKRSTLSRIATW